MKLLPARFMLDRAEETGELRAGGHIVETTSGTFGLALAMLAAARQYRLSLVTADSLVDDVFEHRLKLLGATVVVTEDPNKSGNQRVRLDVVRTLLSQDLTAFWPNQYANAHNPMSYASVASLIIRKIGRVDRLVASVGSGGSISGTAHFLRTAFPELEVVAVDTYGSVLFGQPPAPRRVRGMGNSIVPENLRHDLIDHVHWVGADLAHQATLALYRAHGIFAGPTSGAAFLVADWFARRDPQLKTVFLLPDEGYRYLSTVYAIDQLGDVNLSTESISPGPLIAQLGPAGNDADWSSFVWARRSLAQVMSRT
ncbi:pyridoxal-phosphate dependent enzyme [Aliirhizobium smilacinae]|uniref:Pyridoxal-phosphate dependent enzyme n=2 Tax=Aliirhizobium smilacinae TaxID=1395944 RepID=A0A5C4XCB4_9HYPH|nr:pyridoxal-phosphate dependent enzyme [Rhizobium smilacinae]